MNDIKLENLNSFIEENINKLIIKKQEGKLKLYKQKVWEVIYSFFLDEDKDKFLDILKDKFENNNLIIIENTEFELNDFPNLLNIVKQYDKISKQIIIKCDIETLEVFNKKLKINTNKLSLTYSLALNDFIDNWDKIVLNQIRKIFKYPIKIYLIDSELVSYLLNNTDKLEILLKILSKENKSLIFDSKNINTKQIMRIYKLAKKYWVEVYFQNI